MLRGALAERNTMSESHEPLPEEPPTAARKDEAARRRSQILVAAGLQTA
jgi:hypothetical protein